MKGSKMEKLIRWLIKTFLKGYSLHRNPPKGQKRPRMVNEPTMFNIPEAFVRLAPYEEKGE
jgi:hypothetical protein